VGTCAQSAPTRTLNSSSMPARSADPGHPGGIRPPNALPARSAVHRPRPPAGGTGRHRGLLRRPGEGAPGLRTRCSYRFLFAPGTIGAITWLARNEDNCRRIKHGLVVSMVGDPGGPTYKRSRRGNAKIDRSIVHVLRHSGLKPAVHDFFPYGYDERQYCSPGFDLPVGLFQRSKFAEIPEYHTSADNLDFIRPEHLGDSCRLSAAPSLSTASKCCAPIPSARFCSMTASIFRKMDTPQSNQAPRR
jgi:hypothetical protein